MVSVVFIAHDLEVEKIVTTAVYGGNLVAVEGTYDDVNLAVRRAGWSEHPAWAFVNVNIRTYYAEGSKTLAFEVAEQLGWTGTGRRGRPRRLREVSWSRWPSGFRELYDVALLDEEPHVRVSGRPGRGLLPGGHRLRREHRCHPAREAPHHRQVPGHR